MKISLKHYNDKITIETKHDDLTICEVVYQLHRLCLAAGFNEANVSEAFYQTGQEQLKAIDCNTKPLVPRNKTVGTLFGPDIEPYDGLLRDDTTLNFEINFNDVDQED